MAETAETNFDEFKRKDCVFVVDWLKTKDLHKLCYLFEGVQDSFSDDGINLLRISPFGVIPSDINIVNEPVSIQLNSKDFSSLKCVHISHTCSSI